MFNLPDLTPLIYLAIFGLIAGAVMVIGGLAAAVWFVVNHVQIV